MLNLYSTQAIRFNLLKPFSQEGFFTLKGFPLLSLTTQPPTPSKRLILAVCFARIMMMALHTIPKQFEPYGRFIYEYLSYRKRSYGCLVFRTVSLLKMYRKKDVHKKVDTMYNKIYNNTIYTQ